MTAVISSMSWHDPDTLYRDPGLGLQRGAALFRVGIDGDA